MVTALFEKRAKIDAFFEEFPFLSRYYNHHTLWDVHVLRWDHALLDLQVDGSVINEWINFLNEIRLLDKNFDTVAVVGRKRSVKPWWQIFRSERNNEENLGETLRALGTDASRVTMMVIHRRSHVPQVIVCKPAKGFANMLEWYTSVGDAARDTAKQLLKE